MDRFRVCVVSQQFAEVLSGPGLYTRNLVEELVARGHCVTLVIPQGTARGCPSGVEVIEAGKNGLARKKGGWVILALEFGRVVRKLAKTRDYDLFHFTDAKEALFSVGMGASVVGNINDPYIADKHLNPLFYKTNYPVDWFARWIYLNLMFILERYTLRRLNLGICNSEFTSNIISENYKVTRERLTLCYKSIRLESYSGTQEIESKDGSQIVLFSGGGNAQRKGLIVFLKAVEIVSKNGLNVKYVIVGRDKTIPKILKIYCSEKVSKRLQHIEHVPNEEMKRLYASADVFVMPSLIEAFGVVYLEAMASGTVVIGTTNGGTRELISNRENGLLADPGKTEECAKLVTEVLRNKRLRAELVKKGRETVKQYSTEKMVAETIKIYHRICECDA